MVGSWTLRGPFPSQGESGRVGSDVGGVGERAIPNPPFSSMRVRAGLYFARIVIVSIGVIPGDPPTTSVAAPRGALAPSRTHSIFPVRTAS